MIPSLAKSRDEIANAHDPQALHRMSEICSAFATSLACHYVVTAHDDSGKAAETIQFLNRNGPLPEGHEWLFVMSGHVHPLPDVIGGSALLFIDGEGVYHGTLPTSSTEPTLDHGNLGSALVTKKHTLDSFSRQMQSRSMTTPEDWLASRTFLAAPML